MHMIEAENKNQLLSLLSDINIKVPKRSKGRTTTHVERYAICHMLATLAESNLLRYPIKLKKHERPDFILNHSGVTIGIEHTEAVSINVARSDILKDKGFGPKVSNIKRSIPGENKKSHKQLTKEVIENKSSGPWMGNLVEKDWIKAMAYFTEKKINSSKKPGYQHFDNNILYIYDNWRLPGLEIDEALTGYMDLSIAKQYFITFGEIYIESAPYLCMPNKDGHHKYKLSKLWR